MVSFCAWVCIHYITYMCVSEYEYMCAQHLYWIRSVTEREREGEREGGREREKLQRMMCLCITQYKDTKLFCVCTCILYIYDAMCLYKQQKHKSIRIKISYIFAHSLYIIRTETVADILKEVWRVTWCCTVNMHIFIPACSVHVCCCARRV